LKLRIVLGTFVIGFFGIVASCIYMENPWGIDELYYGYPLLWLNTSKSLLISFPPIPLRVNILWAGFILDLLLYSSGGFVVSYLVFILRENMKLLRFFIKSGIVFFVGSYIVAFLLFETGPRFVLVFPPYEAGLDAFFFSAVATPAATIIYGFCRLFKKRKTQKVSA
jgi:hypothetical protein